MRVSFREATKTHFLDLPLKPSRDPLHEIHFPQVSDCEVPQAHREEVRATEAAGAEDKQQPPQTPRLGRQNTIPRDCAQAGEQQPEAQRHGRKRTIEEVEALEEKLQGSHR